MNKKLFFRFFRIVFMLPLILSCNRDNEKASNSASLLGNRIVQSWITTADRSFQFSLRSMEVEKPLKVDYVIDIDTAKRFQKIQGYGFSLTGGSALVINKMSPLKRSKLVAELFRADSNNIGISYLRISIGASDLDEHVFSYDDLPAGKKDIDLIKFSLNEDRKNLIPLLKEIIDINPEIKIMGSPWSAPSWMKSNGKVKGGSLKKEYYPIYANYIVKYIQMMGLEGIKLQAITVQNEPENPKNTPSMVMSAPEQLEFVRKYLGPAFKKNNLETKIIIYDHNCDHPEYPIEILNDPDANQYIDGSAFHMYLGKVEAMSKVHNAHPDKNIYFTEQWTSAQSNFKDDLFWHIRNLIIGASLNWSSVVLEWNLASDPGFNPHTDDGGCTICQGALTISDSVVRNVSYYIIAHASKFIRPGSYRVASTFIKEFSNAAFITPEGHLVLIVLNDHKNLIHFKIRQEGNSLVTSIPAGSVATFVW
jgi:glucosylceramidase